MSRAQLRIRREAWSGDRCLKCEDGFTLIELMMVVAIIGVLASFAIPAFTGYQNKAKATEAQRGLASIRYVEEAYFAENGTYSSSFTQMGWMGMDPDSRYQFVIVSSSTGGFSAQCSGDIDQDGANDVWIIDQGGELRHAVVD